MPDEANQFDLYIDQMLKELMMKDKQWEKGGTIRVHMDAYQDYLNKNAIPAL